MSHSLFSSTDACGKSTLRGAFFIIRIQGIVYNCAVISSMNPNALTITGMNLRGNGLAPGYEIPFSLTGEKVLPQHKKRKGSVTYALPKVLERSPLRKRPDCKHFGTCGACHFRHVSYEDSVRLKEQLFGEALAAVPGLEQHAPVRMVAAPDPLYYRNNIRFYIEKGTLRQHTMLHHKPFSVEECFVVSPASWQLATRLAPKLPESVTQVEIRENRRGEHMVILTGATNDVPRFPAHSVYLQHGDTLHLVRGEPYLTQYLTVQQQEFAFLTGPESFFQVHEAMAQLLFEHITLAAPQSGSLLDLYAGAGTIGIILAKLFPKLQVTSVEMGEEMSQLARGNAALNDVQNITFMQQDVRTMHFDTSPNCIVIDPPRNGLEEHSLKHLLSLGAQKIIYVSCNPATFLRDLALMLPAYALKDVTLFDMTPFTSHMEVLGVLEKR